MTPKQMSCLDWLRRWFDANEHSPSHQEIAAGLGVASKSRVHELLTALEAHGHVTRIPNRARSVRLTTSHDPVHRAAERLLENMLFEDMETGRAIVRTEDIGRLDAALAELRP